MSPSDLLKLHAGSVVFAIVQDESRPISGRVGIRPGRLASTPTGAHPERATVEFAGGLRLTVGNESIFHSFRDAATDAVAKIRAEIVCLEAVRGEIEADPRWIQA